MTSHRLKWGPFPSIEAGRIAQHVRKGEGKKEGNDKEECFSDEAAQDRTKREIHVIYVSVSSSTYLRVGNGCYLSQRVKLKASR